jgi:hypothetical protein
VCTCAHVCVWLAGSASYKTSFVTDANRTTLSKLHDISLINCETHHRLLVLWQ